MTPISITSVRTTPTAFSRSSIGHHSAVITALAMLATVAVPVIASDAGSSQAAGRDPIVAGSSATPTAPAAMAPLRVVVSIPPLKGLIEPLLPAGTVVEMLVPPGVSEHGYEIPPAKLSALAKADLVVYIGMGMEPQVEKSLAKSPRASQRVIKFESVPGVVATNKPKPTAGDHDHSGHTHDAAGNCVHEIDPHVWLDPLMALSLVDEVALQLAERRISAATPSLSTTEVRAAAMSEIERDPAVVNMRKQLLDLHRRTQDTLGTAQRKTIIVAHDAFGWFAQRYGLEVVAISGLAAGEPKPEAIRDAVNAVRAKSLTTIFIEPQLNPAAANRVAQLSGARVDTLDPLGNGDYFKLMNTNLDALARALGTKDESAKAPAAAK
ncbi:MAG: zinc ABC transporter substrate-binding protein [Phycisphaerales bacterium]|nr:zinc ABC transporter substrate-binding protein [Phycisphaerales bacterium]